VAISGWQENSDINIMDFIRQYEAKGIRYVTCTDIGVDGMLSGPNVALYKKILAQFPALKVVASGGVGSFEHVKSLEPVGVDGVIIGKAIYEGKVTLKQLSTI
jgi:phosphoribosylformimino-5-aminoimidazole carboxamide ribotide isomerase